MRIPSHRPSRWLLATTLAAAACGDDAVGTVSATDSTTASTGPTTTDGPPTTSTPPTSVTDTTDGGGVSATDSGTTTGTTTEGGNSSTTEAVSVTVADTSTSTVGETLTTDSTTTTGDTTEGTTTTTTTTGDTTTGDTTEGTTTEGEAACECPDIEVPLDDGIFVLSDDAELWKYYPETNDFLMLGAFDCDGMTNTFSMAVDRQGFAWVMFNDIQGEIRKIDVTDPTNCIDPGYNPGQQGVTNFGMAFVSNSANDQCDRLYGNTFTGFGGFQEGPNIGNFLSVDPMTLQVSLLGKTNFNGAELSGTGDGRAFMFGGVGPAKLVEIDKANGQFIDVLPLGNLELTNGFAFAHFAGDFYFFTEADIFGTYSKVTHIDYDDSDSNGVQDLTEVAEAPIRIIGAGVSTCAPFIPM